MKQPLQMLANVTFASEDSESSESSECLPPNQEGPAVTRTFLKIASVLVGVHLLLGGILLVYGIDDQNASFAVALTFYYLNLPSWYAVEWMGVKTPEVGAVFLVGIAQWIGIAVVITVVYRAARAAFRVFTGRKSAESG